MTGEEMARVVETLERLEQSDFVDYYDEEYDMTARYNLAQLAGLVKFLVLRVDALESRFEND